MPKLRVESFTISLDGWALSTRTFQKKLFGSRAEQPAAALSEAPRTFLALFNFEWVQRPHHPFALSRD
jgi:hypothetical protein